MKKMMAVLLVLAMALCLAACGEEPVKTETIYVQTQSVRTIAGQEIRMEYTYSAKGTPTSVKTYFNDDLYQTTKTRTSNGINYLTTIDAEGNETTQATEYTYNANGNLTMVEMSISGTTVSRTTYSYDENGNTQSATSVTAAATIVYEYTYDENGNVLTQTETNQTDGTYVRRVYTYDDSGYVIREEVYGDGDVLESYVEYTYEANDADRTKTYYNGDGEATGEVTTYVYDEHGNLIEETTTLDGEVAQRIVNTYEAMEVPVEEE